MTLALTLVAVAAYALSGIGALARLPVIRAGMATVGVPESWLVFPIGTLKIAGAAGLLLGIFGVPYVGAAASIGLILYFTCAVAFHLRAGDYSAQFGLAIVLLALAVGMLALHR